MRRVIHVLKIALLMSAVIAIIGMVSLYYSMYQVDLAKRKQWDKQYRPAVHTTITEDAHTHTGLGSYQVGESYGTEIFACITPDFAIGYNSKVEEATKIGGEQGLKELIGSTLTFQADGKCVPNQPGEETSVRWKLEEIIDVPNDSPDHIFRISFENRPTKSYYVYMASKPLGGGTEI